jgi:hypothetical protein
MTCESNIMYGIEIQGLNEAETEVDKVHGRFSSKWG